MSLQNFGNANSKFEAGHIVVCPPQKVYKYSMYDELELGKDRFKELLSAVEPKLVKQNHKRTKINKFFKNLLKIAITTSAVILAYKNRSTIKNFSVNIFNKLQNLIKKR